MKKIFLLLIIVCCLAAGEIWAKAVTIVYEKGVPQASYAARKLGKALAGEGYKVTSLRTRDYLICLAVHQGQMKPEAFSIVPEGKIITVCGGDNRGMIYGALALAEMLERDNRKALCLMESIDTSGNAALMYEVADVKTWANLGLHLAEKLKGAIALHSYRLTGDEENKRDAIEHLQKALEYWDEVIKITRPIYRDMQLTHYNNNSFDANRDNLFHWALIRDEVARDVEIARSSQKQ
jgi:hypothetical protein